MSSCDNLSQTTNEMITSPGVWNMVLFGFSNKHLMNYHFPSIDAVAMIYNITFALSLSLSTVDDRYIQISNRNQCESQMQPKIMHTVCFTIHTIAENVQHGTWNIEHSSSQYSSESQSVKSQFNLFSQTIDYSWLTSRANGKFTRELNWIERIEREV